MIIRDKTTGEEVDTGNKISRLSKMARRVYAFSEGLEKVKSFSEFDLKMITLTYAPSHKWHKNHVRDFLRALRRHVGGELLAYAWVAELQKRGAVHYHLYAALGKGARIPRPDDSGMWPYGMSRTEKGKSVFYISAYTSKKYQKLGIFPKGLRMYSVWIKPGLLSERDFWEFKLSAYPKWLTDQILAKGDFYLGQVPCRRPGGGWRIKHPNSTKEHCVWVPFFSPYEIVRFTSPGSGFPNLFALEKGGEVE